MNILTKEQAISYCYEHKNDYIEFSKEYKGHSEVFANNIFKGIIFFIEEGRIRPEDIKNYGFDFMKFKEGDVLRNPYGNRYRVIVSDNINKLYLIRKISLLNPNIYVDEGSKFSKEWIEDTCTFVIDESYKLFKLIEKIDK